MDVDHGLVIGVAHVLYSHFPPHVDIDDLIAAGYEGLVQASRRFDPDEGVSFRNYAKHRVRGAMLDWARTNDYMPRRHLPGDEAPLSLDVPPVDGGAPLGDRLARDNDSGEDRVDAQMVVRDLLAELPERHRYVIVNRYWTDRSQHEIAADLGVTESRVTQLETAALELLRQLAGVNPSPADGHGLMRRIVVRHRREQAETMVGRGMSTGEIAAVLSVTRKTVRSDLRWLRQHGHLTAA